MGAPRNGRPGRVLYVGQAYYNTWYLSRELRKLGWRADVLSWDGDPASAHHYHGADYRFRYGKRTDTARHLGFYLAALRDYDIFHFSNAHGLKFGGALHAAAARYFSEGDEIRLLKRLGKKIVYSNNGCLDGVAQSSFASWGEYPTCVDCPWLSRPDICSDERNLAWGAFRNSVADYQILFGGNRADYNVDSRIHEVPEFYCLDESFWRPDLEVPAEMRLGLPDSTVKVYHAVGNALSRSEPGTMRNIKSTHVYLPLIEELKRAGHDVELVFFHDVPNSELRYLHVQADIHVDMLTFGWFGAGVREALMLGKPVICNLNPLWRESMRREVPEYVDELPVISATPETVKPILEDLIANPAKRAEIGRRSRDFAVKYHSSKAAARRFDEIYKRLLGR